MNQDASNQLRIIKRVLRRLLCFRRRPPKPSTPQLQMRCKLGVLPQLVVPEGYELRTLQPSDAAMWAALLHENGALGAWTVERAAPFFAPNSPMSLAGSFLVIEHGKAAATAQFHLKTNGANASIPELGWVAVSPVYQGKGLGYLVCLAVMHYAASQGYSEIYLLTDGYRLPAIQLYLKLGFKPWLDHPTASGHWDAVLQKLHDYGTDRSN